MQDDFKYIKIRPANGILKDKEGRTLALVWIFRPDVAMEKRCWFESQNAKIGDHGFLCIEVGFDGIPVNCKQIYENSDGPDEWEPVGDEKILKCFEFCCDLLKDHKMQQTGGEIIEDTFFGDVAQCSK